MSRQANHSLVEERLEAFEGVLEQQKDHPPTGDPYVAAFSGALLDSFVEEPFMRDRYHDILEAREIDGRPVSSSGLTRMSVAGVQMFLLRDKKLGYPHGFDVREAWREVLPGIIVPKGYDVRTDEFSFDLVQRTLQSNVPERYKGIKLPLLLYAHRFGETALILDIGCSVNHGLKKLSQPEEFPFQPVDVVVTGDTYDDKKMQHAINTMLAQSVQIVGVGVDPWPLHDEETAQWVKSCSFYPSELLNKARTLEYDRLSTTGFANITFENADFADTDQTCFPGKEPDQLYDMVSFSTVLYQLRERPDKIKAMFVNAKRHLGPNGIIVVQDFVQLDPVDPMRLHFPDNFHEEPFGYRTLIYDRAYPQRGFQELIRWEDGRCSTMLWGESVLAEAAQEQATRAA